jgi:hypothetical protein
VVVEAYILLELVDQVVLVVVDQEVAEQTGLLEQPILVAVVVDLEELAVMAVLV